MLPENPAEKSELFQSYHLPAQNRGSVLVMVCDGMWKVKFTFSVVELPSGNLT